MTLADLPRRLDGQPLLCHAIAVVAAALAVGARLVLDPLIGVSAYAFLPLFPAILAVAWACGSAPAFVTVIVGALGTIWLVLEPRGRIDGLAPSDAVGVVLFMLAAAACVAVAHAQRKAESAARENHAERRRSERQASALLSSLPDGAAFVIDADLRIELGEGDLGGMLEAPPRTLAGRSAVEALAPIGADAASFRDALGGSLVERETRVGERIVAWRGVPMRDDEGRVYGVLATAVDVTERRRARDAQRESERRLRSLANAMPQLVWMADAAGTVSYYNGRVDQYAGLKRSDDGTWAWSAVVHPDDVPATVDAWEKARDAGTPYAMEHRLRMMDGSYRWHLSRATRGRDGAADSVTWYGTATDIHDLKRTEERLRESVRRSQLAVRVGQIGTWRIDPVAGEMEIDERTREIWGETASKLSAKRVRERTHPDDYARVRAAVARALTPGGDGHYDIEHRIVRPDGAERWVVGAGLAEFEDGKPTQMVGTVRDVTERKVQEAALRRSEERYRAFVANSSEGIWCLEFEPPIDIAEPAERQVELVYERGRYVECNDAMARMYGLESPQQLIGRSVAMMLPSDEPAARDYLRSIIDAGYAVQDAESEERDVEGRTRWFLNGVRAVIEDGRMTRVWGTQREITDLKRAEAARAEVARRLGEDAASA